MIMLLNLKTLLHPTTKNNPLNSKLNFLKTLKMLSPLSKPKRPTCPNCSKPLKLCLCSRFSNTALDNSVHVTILQHSLEKKHPLNSTRIAKLGLKNLTVVTVSDVLFNAKFEIQALEGNSEKCFDGSVLDCAGSEKALVFEKTENESVVLDSISVIVDKYGVVGSVEHPWMDGFRSQKPSFSEFLEDSVAREVLAKGFVVRKIGEFELIVPPGSVLLFPTDEAVDVDGLRGAEFEVKNLIVLDGTWAKAMRMYNENPWFKLLPHLKLNLETLSLYGEVRHQPKAGYLSTIESIVYTLKAVGEDPDGLDKLLDVFKSMVGDQRRCKDERLSNAS